MLHLLAILLATLSFLDPPTAAAPTEKPAQQPAAAPAKSAEKTAPPTEKQLDCTIDGTTRETLLFIPSSAATTPTPVIFAFHGHGGNARNAARNFQFHKHWPEAITVYMQGLPTPGMTDPKGEKNGWQKTAFDQNGRDLKFFDAVLGKLKQEYKVDDTRIYATGHSNGAAFTYLLWSARPDIFAAVAPSAGGFRDIEILKPKPAMHIASRKDPLVPFDYQSRVMEQVRAVNKCEPKGTEWAKDCTLYASTTQTPFIAMIHAGNHAFPAEAPPLIVKFFKEHPAPTK